MTRMILLAMTLLIILAGMAFLLAPGTVRTLVGTALSQMREPALPQPKVAEPDKPWEQETEVEKEEEIEPAQKKLKESDRARTRAREEPPRGRTRTRQENIEDH